MPVKSKSSASPRKAVSRATPARVGIARAGPRTRGKTTGTAGASSMREEVAAFRKDLILKAAREAFFEHGYHDCTVDMIAERLSGSKAIVYHYFPDKHSLLQETYQRAMHEAQTLIREAIAAHDTPTERLAAIARRYARWVIDNQRVVGVFWREVRALSAEARAAVAVEQKRMDDLLAATIQQGVTEGSFKVPDVRSTARAIAGMITFVYTWWRDDKRLSRDDAADYYALMALRLVGARGV